MWTSREAKAVHPPIRAAVNNRATVNADDDAEDANVAVAVLTVATRVMVDRRITKAEMNRHRGNFLFFNMDRMSYFARRVKSIGLACS